MIASSRVSLLFPSSSRFPFFETLATVGCLVRLLPFKSRFHDDGRDLNLKPEARGYDNVESSEQAAKVDVSTVLLCSGTSFESSSVEKIRHEEVLCLEAQADGLLKPWL